MSPRQAISTVTVVIRELTKACILLGAIWLAAFLVGVACVGGLR